MWTYPKPNPKLGFETFNDHIVPNTVDTMCHDKGQKCRKLTFDWVIGPPNYGCGMGLGLQPKIFEISFWTRRFQTFWPLGGVK